MSVSTTKQKKPKAQTSFVKLTDEQMMAANEQWIDIGSVVIGHNDRKEFDQSAIDTLAVSIQERGLDNAITVRVKELDPVTDEKTYELIAGERRLRACRKLGLVRIRAKVVKADDRHADLLRLEENMLREDLNQIERAAGLQRYIELHGESQSQVGKRFGMTQAQVSNLLRLLQLPKYWQDQIASGAIGHTIVRDVLLPWAHRPQVLEAIREEWERSLKVKQPMDRQELQFCIDRAVRDCSRLVRKEMIHHWTRIVAETCCFKFDAEKHAKLLDVDDDGRAWNLQEWEKLNEPARLKAIEKQKADKKKSGHSASTSAQEKKKAKAAAESGVNDHKLKEALRDQLLPMLGSVLHEKKHKQAIPLLFIWASSCDELHHHLDVQWSDTGRMNDLLHERRDEGLKMMLEMIKCFCDGDSFFPQEPAHVIGAAELLPFDLLHDWIPTAAVLEAYSTDLLQAFAHDHEIDHTQPREALIADLCKAWSSGYCTKEVLALCGRSLPE